MAVCTDFVNLKERVRAGLRGFRYFNLDEYGTTPDSKMRL
jgi:hypothetical protein